MKTFSIIAASVTLAMLAACGSGNAPDQTAANPAPPAGTVSVPKSNVFNPLVQDLNKAKQVQNQLQAEKQKTDQQIQAQSAATSDGDPDQPR